MKQSLTKQLLLSSNYWVLNKTVVRLFGLETAFLLSNFAEAEQMMADKEGWFYQTSETVEEMTTLTRHKQDQCIKQLEGMNVLFKDVKGMPAKRYFKINYQCLTNLIVNSQQTGLQNIDKLDCKKSATNKESSYKELNYKESISTTTTITKKDINLIVEEWNKLNLQNLRSINSNTKRYTSLKARIKEYSLDEVVQAIRSISKSDFLKGQNNKGWTITFDWLVKPNNFLKVLEGNYLDKEGNNGGYKQNNSSVKGESGEGEIDWAERAGVKSF